MDENAKVDLPYGHFGHAEYSTETSIWHFGRVVSGAAPFRPLGTANVVLTGDVRGSTVQKSDRHEPVCRRHPREIKDLSRTHSEFRAAAQLLSPLLRVSEAVQRADHSHESFQRNLVDFAEIWSAVQHHSIPVVALTSGETGAVLRLVERQIQKQSWAAEDVPYLNVPTLASNTFTLRHMEAPIQQLCFSRKVDRSSPLLAVRTTKEINIFQPWHGKTSSDRNLGLDLLFTISFVDTGGYVQVDMVFNPWYHQQFGIVDSRGNWTILEFDSRRMRKVSRSWRGTSCVDDTQSSVLAEDGWSRIAWIRNVETVLICTRQKLTLYSIAGDAPVVLAQTHIDSASTGVRMLDVLFLPGYMESLALLTSTHIMVLNIQEWSDALRIHLQTKVRHFKNADSLDLRLTCWTDNDDAAAVNLLVYANEPDSAMAYRVVLQETGVVVDGGPVQLPLRTHFRTPAQAIAEVRVRCIELVKSKATTMELGEVGDHPTHHAHFYAATVLFTDRTLTERLFYRASPGLSHHELAMPSWTSRVNKAKVKSSSRIVPDMGFIVDHESEAALGSRRTEPVARKRRRPTKISAVQQSVSLELIARQLDSSVVVAQNMNHLAARIKAAAGTTTNATNKPYMPTFCDLLDGQINVGDVQEASETLSEALLFLKNIVGDPNSDMEDPSDGQTRREVALVCIPEASKLQLELVNCTITSVYDHLVAGWISPLPADISGWVRLAKAAIVRRIATEMVLASKSLLPEMSQQPPSTLEPQDAEDLPGNYSMQLPLRGLESITRPPSTRLTPNLFVLPTPSPTGTPSVNTMSSSPSAFRAHDLSHLERYATLEKPAPSALPRTLRNVLSHWNVGEDPQHYDWLARSRAQARQNEEEDDDKTEKERKAAIRKAERHLQRQRKEAAASQAQQLASIQATEIFSASQPPVLNIEGTSSAPAGSSQPFAQGHVASQVVPGRHGGRPPKKRRKQGF